MLLVENCSGHCGDISSVPPYLSSPFFDIRKTLELSDLYPKYCVRFLFFFAFLC